jgi:hypothetical protein
LGIALDAASGIVLMTIALVFFGFPDFKIPYYELNPAGSVDYYCIEQDFLGNSIAG